MSLSEVINNHVKSLKDVPELSDYFRTGKLLISKKEVLETIRILSETFNDDLIIYGGVMVYPEIIGYNKHLRNPSNDLDCLVTRKGLELLKDCYYIESFDTAFTMINKVPVSLSYKHIHDFKVPKDFYDNIIKINNVNYCSPDYLIIMKF